ncbi:Cytoplasmic dynein light chain [Fasciolopsis buskii]|uniref:Dynein light chain n=1 Tax=Fasciolopsis buskii TaxID=27845 RepID=A0A8E0VJB5_9TREM|nr:Cytoplasmic dynein light chain [Fasciolopsis buski]
MSSNLAEIRKVEMPREMQDKAVHVASMALDQFQLDWQIAAYIREEFEKLYNESWHCIVGRSFGGSIRHESEHFIYFYLRSKAFMLYR